MVFGVERMVSAAKTVEIPHVMDVVGISEADGGGERNVLHIGMEFVDSLRVDIPKITQ